MSAGTPSAFSRFSVAASRRWTTAKTDGEVLS